MGIVLRLGKNCVASAPCVVRDAAWRPLLTMTNFVQSAEFVILRSRRSRRLEGWPQAAACGAILRDAVLRTAPQDEVVEYPIEAKEMPAWR